jgi:predicted DCC family thiol-disulfide oxidoreductase YuxK
MTQRTDAWVLFDAACGFCNRWVPFWHRLLRAHGVGIAPLQAPWVRERLGIPERRLLEDLLILESRRKVHVGADAYRFAFRRIPWAWPFDLVSRIPGCRTIFDAAYRAFSRNRYRISRGCRLSKEVRGD